MSVVEEDDEPQADTAGHGGSAAEPRAAEAPLPLPPSWSASLRSDITDLEARLRTGKRSAVDQEMAREVTREMARDLGLSEDELRGRVIRGAIRTGDPDVRELVESLEADATEGSHDAP